MYMPPAHMNTDGCEALSAVGPKYGKSTGQMATNKIY